MESEAGGQFSDRLAPVLWHPILSPHFAGTGGVPKVYSQK